MNWKLIFGLSLFGLAMAYATVEIIPEKMEMIFWLGIFIICSLVIAKYASGKYFLHGFLVSMVNCIWITLLHVSFYDKYTANHPMAVETCLKLMNHYMRMHPRQAMIILAPFFGAIFGIVLGLFSWTASKIVKN